MNAVCTEYVNCVSFSDAVIYYNWFVPEGERHDSALKRNREALASELKLWEGYLQKVVYAQYTHKHKNKLDMLGRVQTCCIFHPFLSSWALAPTWQDPPFHWQM